jgi:hypothetical protein
MEALLRQVQWKRGGSANTSGSHSPARSLQAIIMKVDGGYTVTTVLSIDGQVRVLSEKTVDLVGEAGEIARALARLNHVPWVDVELAYR